MEVDLDKRGGVAGELAREGVEVKEMSKEVDEEEHSGEMQVRRKLSEQPFDTLSEQPFDTNNTIYKPTRPYNLLRLPSTL